MKIKNGLITLSFLSLVLLSVVHWPVVSFQKDTIGVYDFYISFLFVAIFIVLAPGLSFKVPEKIRLVFFAYLFFVLYASIIFVVYHIKHNSFDLFSFAFLVKQYEFLVISTVYFYFIKRINLNGFYYYLFAIVLIISMYGFYKILTGSWYRLGLIFLETEGNVSPNPAGFILATSLLTLVFLYTDRGYRLNFSKFDGVLFLIVFIVGYVALLLTFGRTNNMAFIIVSSIFFLRRYGAATLKYLPLILLATLLPMLYVYYYSSVHTFGRLPLLYMFEPSLVFSDASVDLRMNNFWLAGFEDWKSSLLTMFFGIGVGSIRATDALLPNLLYNTGLVGAAIYYSIISMIFLKFRFEVRLITAFILINSLTAETTLQSFRTMQVFLLNLTFMLYYYSSGERERIKADE